MKKPILVRKQAGGGLQYQVTQEGSKPRVPFMQNLAAVRGGARGLVTDPNTNNVRQGFIPGAQLGDAKPTGMQRLAAGANVAGTGLAAALTGLQTLYGLQGGNLGALASAKDQFRANVGGLTGGSPTEAQQAQNMATEAFNQQQQTMAQNAMMQQATPPRQGNLTVGAAPPTYGSSSATPATPPATTTPPPAGLPTPPPVPTSPTGVPISHTLTYPAVTNETGKAPPPGSQTAAPAQAAQPASPDMENAAGALASTNFNPQQELTPQQTSDVQAAAQLLGNANVAHVPARTSGQGNQIPQYSGAFPVQQPAAPMAVSQPVDNGLTPHQGALPVMMPQQTHEEQRQQVAVKQPVEAPYKPNQFFNPTGQKPGHPYNTGQFAPTKEQYGLSSNVDYRNRAMPANFGGISWDSAVPSLGDDPSINWDEIRNAFVSQVLDEFGDMLHKADPHVAGAVAMRVFLEKMLRK